MLRHISIRLWLALTFSVLSVEAALLPGCQEVALQQELLIDVRTASIDVPSPPWAIKYASQKDRAFVTLTKLSIDGTVQFRNRTVRELDASTFPPTLSHQVPLPKAYQPPETTAAVTRIPQLVECR
jgi:hypothetical protein